MNKQMDEIFTRLGNIYKIKMIYVNQPTITVEE